ncbi:hypothetical protein QU487_06565 [Crenobacter sp. SG2305]|uniref:hypothetical protein n=1 Tax=Crenobacter oryzisoli TaxID=3056844 RepID=UPI0025AA9FD2|nr:hypothetical protein [Crenobacter sp. SG2305]MDN0082416.1 hypothetical protein [Crenobacter sp. SG2305]
MQRGSKTISNSMRPQIENLKANIRAAIRPFDGTGSAFKTALKELRAEGLRIVYVAEKCHYIKVG